jgi:integrase
LYLDVRPSGERFWRYRYKIGGRENLATFGRYPDVGLSAARDAHRAARDLVAKGVHPRQAALVERAQRIESNAATFAAVAQEWQEKGRAQGFKSRRNADGARPWTPTYAKHVAQVLGDYVLPEVGSLPVDKVTAGQIRRIADAVALGKHKLQQGKNRAGRRTGPSPSIAVAIAQWSAAVVGYAVAMGKAQSNPVREVLRYVQRQSPKSKEPLDGPQVGEFLRKVQAAEIYWPTKKYLTLLALLWCRPGELRQAEWSELDLEGGAWQLPEGKMKMRRSHVVPLSAEAIAVFRELHTLTGGGKWIFPNMRDADRPMVEGTGNAALTRLGYAGRFSVHGFRSTAATLLAEAGVPAEYIEAQLSHLTAKGVAGRYNKALFLPQRVRVMAVWGRYVAALTRGDSPDLGVMWAGMEGGNVLPIKMRAMN